MAAAVFLTAAAAQDAEAPVEEIPVEETPVVEECEICTDVIIEEPVIEATPNEATTEETTPEDVDPGDGRPVIPGDLAEAVELDPTDVVSTADSVLVIGDSLTVGTQMYGNTLEQDLRDAGVTNVSVSAESGRPTSTGLSILESAGVTDGAVVLALGTNDVHVRGADTFADYIDRAMAAVPENVQVYWLNLYTDQWVSDDAYNATIVSKAGQYVNLHVMDFESAASSSWLAGDNVHLSPNGYIARSQFITEQLRLGLSLKSEKDVFDREPNIDMKTTPAGLPEPVKTGLELIEAAAGSLQGTQIIINPEEQTMYHVVNGELRIHYNISTGRGSMSNWSTNEWSFLGNGAGTQRSSTGYMTTIGAEKTICDVDEIGAQWTPTTCSGQFAQTTWDKPGEPLWNDNVLHGELTTVILRMYPQELSNSNNMTRGILIHGTNKYASVQEQIPASRGCTRMMPLDILDLAAHLDDGVNQIFVLDREPNIDKSITSALISIKTAATVVTEPVEVETQEETEQAVIEAAEATAAHHQATSPHHQDEEFFTEADIEILTAEGHQWSSGSSTMTKELQKILHIGADGVYGNGTRSAHKAALQSLELPLDALAEQPQTTVDPDEPELVVSSCTPTDNKGRAVQATPFYLSFYEPFCQAAKANGMYATSSYRSYSYQQYLYNTLGDSVALAPWLSNHTSGNAIDVSGALGWRHQIVGCMNETSGVYTPIAPVSHTSYQVSNCASAGVDGDQLMPVKQSQIYGLSPRCESPGSSANWADINVVRCSSAQRSSDGIIREEWHYDIDLRFHGLA